MLQGVDYSFSRPDINCLWNAGHRFVVRYATGLRSSKQASKTEIQALLNKGFKVVIVYQDGTGDVLGGFDAGVRIARNAEADLRDWGMQGAIVYFTLDRDPNPLTASQITTIKNTLNGIASVLGRNRVGLYGGFRAIELFVPTHAAWGWQTFAWSGGRISSKAHFRQYRNGVNLCGGQVDLNETFKADFGQWPRTSSPVSPTPSKDWLSMATKKDVEDAVVTALDRYNFNTRVALIVRSQLNDKLKRGENNDFTSDFDWHMARSLSGGDMAQHTRPRMEQLVARVVNQVLDGRQGQRVELAPEDVAALADRLAEAGIGPAVVDELKERLSK